MKTLRLTWFILFLIMGAAAASGQKEANTWYFGEYAGLDFNTGSPVALLNSAMNKDEGCSSISDSNGNLLFYTSGIKVWNRNHSQMPNGSGLTGHESSSQAALIVPKPGSSNLYYIFTTDAFFYANGLRYSVVDMSLQGGMGDVTMKNVLLHSPSTEKLTAVKHSNNTDIWVIAHAGNSDVFQAYLVTSGGISPPVSTPIGTPHTGGGINGTLNAIGCMKASPDGTRLALTLYNMNLVELFDFNTTTGALSNPVSFPAIYTNAYGVEFSPDNSKLYFTSDTTVFQADLNAGSPSLIITSTVPVGLINWGPFGYGTNYLGALQLGPDDKIYGTSFFSEYLFVINIPNAPGVECNFVEQGVWLGGQHCYGGLPGFVQSWFYSPPQSITGNSAQQPEVLLYPNPAQDAVTIKVENTTISSIEILTIQGAQVLHAKHTDHPSTIMIPVDHLPEGAYIIRIFTLQEIVSRKMMKGAGCL